MGWQQWDRPIKAVACLAVCTSVENTVKTQWRSFVQKRLATKLRACLYIPSGDGVSGKPHHLMESRSGLGNEVLEDASHLYITTMAVKENSMYRWLLCQCLPNCPARCDSGDIMAVSTTSRSDVGRTDSQPIQAPSLS